MLKEEMNLSIMRVPLLIKKQIMRVPVAVKARGVGLFGGVLGLFCGFWVFFCFSCVFFFLMSLPILPVYLGAPYAIFIKLFDYL
jgi:hypothetical protein